MNQIYWQIWWLLTILKEPTINLKKSCVEEFIEAKDCWYSRVRYQYQRFEFGNRNYKRKLMNSQEIITYILLVIIGIQVDVKQ